MLEDEALYFAHLPKNSGNAVRDALGRWFDAAEMLPTFRQFDPATLPAGTLSRYRYIGSHLQRQAFDTVAASAPRRWWKVAFLREPQERLDSHLRFIARVPSHGLHGRVAGKAWESVLRDPVLYKELADHQSSFVIYALSPRERPRKEAAAVLAEEADIVGLTACVEASLLMIAYRLRQLPVRPYDLASFGHVDPDKRLPGGGRQPLDPAQRDALAEWNGLDQRLYEAGVARFSADFATFCESAGQAPIDPFRATLADLAPLRAAVHDAAVAALLRAPQPVGTARLLRFRQSRPLRLLDDRDGGLLLRRFWAYKRPIVAQFHRGQAPLGEIELRLYQPDEEPPPRVTLEGRELSFRQVGPRGEVMCYRADAGGVDLQGKNICELQFEALHGRLERPAIGLVGLRIALRN